MNVAGFREALESALHVRVDTDLVIPVASLHGLVILKLFAWVDRKHEERDAPDILKILADYTDAGNEDRLYTDQLPLLEAAGFDVTILAPNSWAKMPAASQVRRPRRSITKLLADPDFKARAAKPASERRPDGSPHSRFDSVPLRILGPRATTCSTLAMLLMT
jgi:predicted nucleotidyltransferase